MKVLKTSSCKTLSGKSTLTYQIGCTPESKIHLRITKNTGAGFFSDEWIAFDDIQAVLKERPRGTPVLSHLLTPLLKGKSVNTSAFLLAAMKHLKLVSPLPKKKRVHELVDPRPFLEMVENLMSSPAGEPKGTTAKKAPVKKAVRKTAAKKAAVKKRAMAKRKATTRSTAAKKASPTQR
jgi:hypothetical protein